MFDSSEYLSNSYNNKAFEAFTKYLDTIKSEK